MKLAEISFSSAVFQSREKILGKKLGIMENFELELETQSNFVL